MACAISVNMFTHTIDTYLIDTCHAQVIHCWNQDKTMVSLFTCHLKLVALDRNLFSLHLVRNTEELGRNVI